VKAVLQFGLRGYQRCISPMLPHACRFVPTCSEYALEAVERYGALRGSWLALARLLRCHPLARAGYDPVPPEKHSSMSNEASPQTDEPCYPSTNKSPARRLRCKQTPATCGTMNPRTPRHSASSNLGAGPTRQPPPLATQRRSRRPALGGRAQSRTPMGIFALSEKLDSFTTTFQVQDF
jgi:uncharacterized protein